MHPNQQLADDLRNATRIALAFDTPDDPDAVDALDARVVSVASWPDDPAAPVEVTLVLDRRLPSDSCDPRPTADTAEVTSSNANDTAPTSTPASHGAPNRSVSRSSTDTPDGSHPAHLGTSATRPTAPATSDQHTPDATEPTERSAAAPPSSAAPRPAQRPANGDLADRILAALADLAGTARLTRDHDPDPVPLAAWLTRSPVPADVIRSVLADHEHRRAIGQSYADDLADDDDDDRDRALDDVTDLLGHARRLVLGPGPETPLAVRHTIEAVTRLVAILESDR